MVEEGNIMQYAGLTDIGRERTNNEDLWLCHRIWNNSYILAAVIDGVGGYEGGEMAARIASEELLSYLETYPNGERSQLLREAMIHANNCIYHERTVKTEYADMGCVMTAILIEPMQGTVDMVHIGDTRLYELSDGMLTKLSHDQSPVGKYEDWGLLSEKEAMEHPLRNIIERDLGNRMLDNTVENYIEAKRFLLKPDSVLLLCSDGLTDLVTGARIRDILLSDSSLEIQAQQLVNAANEAGGKDNVTVVLLRNRIMDSMRESDEEKSHVLSTQEQEFTEDEENVLQTQYISESRRFETVVKRSGYVVMLLLGGFVMGWYLRPCCLDSRPEKTIPSMSVFGIIPADTADVDTDSALIHIYDTIGYTKKNLR